mmetsp:Transcript_46507/g.105074  ORF Transcript_46507/g.105074 Transcript_46507/m.105074 type:complete len:299 (+) Transcript_46507:1566-2462(+)
MRKNGEGSPGAGRVALGHHFCGRRGRGGGLGRAQGRRRVRLQRQGRAPGRVRPEAGRRAPPRPRLRHRGRVRGRGNPRGRRDWTGEPTKQALIKAGGDGRVREPRFGAHGERRGLRAFVRHRRHDPNGRGTLLRPGTRRGQRRGVGPGDAPFQRGPGGNGRRRRERAGLVPRRREAPKKGTRRLLRAKRRLVSRRGFARGRPRRELKTRCREAQQGRMLPRAQRRHHAGCPRGPGRAALDPRGGLLPGRRDLRGGLPGRRRVPVRHKGVAAKGQVRRRPPHRPGLATRLLRRRRHPPG